jgi:hypothetical protein
MKDLKLLAKRLHSVVGTIVTKQIDFEPKKGAKQLAFSEQKKVYYENQLKSTIKLLQNKKPQILSIIDDTNTGKKIQKLITDLSMDDLPKLKDQSEKLLQLTADLVVPKEITTDLPKNIPPEIRGEVYADITELHKCMNTGCYRSVIILCGRILETVLHRKYYDVTGKDILETNPSIGLGTLISKLKDKEVQFDPALTQQIHLINQVRIFSVHKKQEVFQPSRNQTQAIVLYTLDVIDRII